MGLKEEVRPQLWGWSVVDGVSFRVRPPGAEQGSRGIECADVERDLGLNGERLYWGGERGREMGGGGGYD